MEDEALEKALSGNLARINDWLRFAETKNAALLTFSSAWLVAICSIWSNDRAPLAIKISMLVAAPSVIVAALIALVSLLPRIQNKSSKDTAQQLTTQNLLFHGNLANLDIATSSNVLRNRYRPGIGKEVSGNHIQDLCTQIVETSVITKTKFTLFTNGAKSILVALVTAIIAFIIAHITAG